MPSAPENEQGGYDWNGAIGGFGTGLSAGTAVTNYFNSVDAMRRQRRQMRRNFESTAAQLRDILGIATGNVLTNPGNDFVGGLDDPRSRYLATGTLVGGPAGGINPLVLQARKRLFELLQTKAIPEKALQTTLGNANVQQGQQLEATARAPARTARGALAGLMDFGGGGVPAVSARMQAAIANRLFGRQIAQSGMSMLQALYGAAGSTV